ncbi:hypothetical protein IEQ34_010529 [Dendrobium chrysotoxum]|uniref:Uncharacterized protein n=1 Tax=Dendrobium chrysotoxum TaxID=161865 RepID=A0AAV7GT67_DENCH|nr:hypothetical protein IEQ34_010529 [Dendrobium chrysotoxum]
MVNGENGVDDTLALQNFIGNIVDAAIVEGLACSSLNALPLTHSCGINEGVVASSIVSDGETMNSDDFAPSDPVDRDCSAAKVLDNPASSMGLAKNMGEPLFYVPLSVISNESLVAQLACKSGENGMMRDDWLHDDNSSAYEDILNSRDNFDLSILQISDVDYDEASFLLGPWMVMACCGNLGVSFFCMVAGGYSSSNGWSKLSNRNQPDHINLASSPRDEALPYTMGVSLTEKLSHDPRL